MINNILGFKVSFSYRLLYIKYRALVCVKEYSDSFVCSDFVKIIYMTIVHSTVFLWLMVC